MIYWVEESFFRSYENIDSFLHLSRSIYHLMQPDYGSIHQTQNTLDMLTYDTKLGKKTVATDLNKGIPGIYWANFFGPKIVAKIGKERLLSVPSNKTMQLHDGGLLILTSPSPIAPTEPENSKKREEIRAMLGENSFIPKQTSIFR